MTLLDDLHEEAIAQEADEFCDTAWTAELLRRAKAEVERLQAEIANAWRGLDSYGTDARVDLADENESPEDVELIIGIQQLGEVAYQWRAEAEQLREAANAAEGE